MNGDKAREYFSSYREGTLEGGIRQSFEQKVRSDRQLQAEYDAFLRTMDELDTLKDEEIPVPFYLNARIHARLEEARTPVKKSRTLVFYLPRFAIAAAAAAAILFAAKGILKSPSSAGAPIQAGVISGGDEPASEWPSESIGIESRGPVVQIHYTSATDRTVEILDGTRGKLREYQLKAGEPLKPDLKNSNPSATIFEIQVSDGGPDEYIAVPGSGSRGTENTPTGQENAAGESGTVLEFAKALANRYGKPVVYTGRDVSVPLSWNLTQPTDKAAADQVLSGTKLDVAVTATGVLSISER